MKKVFITLISFNNNKVTLECLESLEKVRKNNFELNIVVIDNASKEKFKTLKKYLNFTLKIIRSEENLGFSGGQNLGIKYSLERGADYVVILNNDTEVDENLVSNLIKSFRDNIGIVSPKIYFAKGYEFHKDRYKENEKGKVIWYAGGIIDWENVIGIHKGVDEVDKGQFNSSMETEYATGCCMMVKAQVFEKIGFLDDKYFLYYEDADFCIRARNNNFKVIFEPSGLLWHKNASSAGGSGSSLQDYYITRNRLIFGFRYAKTRAKIALFKESLKILLSGRKWQKTAVKDFYLNIYEKGSFVKND